MSDSTFGFIGLGLIGGSIARGLRRANKDITIMAYMRTRSKLEQAKADGTIDIILDGIDETLSACDVIFLCTPVEYNAVYLEKVRPFLKPGALITDIGSTKTDIHQAVERLGYEDVFVGGHPMAGSEKTGYESSTDHLLENAYYIITPTKKSTPEQIDRIRQVALGIGALPIVLDYHEHDFSVAAISHLPHLVASSLVNLVHDNDSKDEIMKRLAAGGFKDITRIASSSPVMWEQICMTNTVNISRLLQDYIDALGVVQKELQEHDSSSLYTFFDGARAYRDSFIDAGSGPIKKDYSIRLDIPDEAGSIAAVSTLLALNNISIKNIGIVHNREAQEGVLRIEFYEEDSITKAIQLLNRRGYVTHI